MDEKQSLTSDLLQYLGVGSYDTTANKLQGDRAFKAFLEKKHGKDMDTLLSEIGLSYSSMSDIAQQKANTVAVCANCGNEMRIADIQICPPDLSLKITVAPCGRCRFAVGEVKENTVNKGKGKKKPKEVK